VNTRAVRLLDRRPGQPADDARTVAGYVIERGVPIPRAKQDRSALREAIEALAVGESLVCKDIPHDLLKRARERHPGCTWTQRKIKTGGWRVWRTT
jgi:hypothetical protein